MTTRRLRAFAVFLLLFGLAACHPGDVHVVAPDSDRPVDFAGPPRRVVSLYPTASEILAALGTADCVAGVTLHDSGQPGLENKPLVGGFATPDLDRVLALKPDCVIASPFQADAVRALREQGVPVLVLDTATLADGEANIRRLGSLTGRHREAEELIARERGLLELAAAKTAKLAENPEHAPVRAIRVMGVADGKLMVPGDDSFQNEIIARAGGRAPSFGRNGPAITISPGEWRAFDPQAVLFCGDNGENVRRGLAAPAWSGVAALKTGTLLSYPCELISRAATHYGYISLWLSSDMYGRQYSDADNQTAADAVLARKPLDLPFAFVADAEVLDSRLFDMPARTLLVRFTKPQTVLSSLSGWSDGILAVGNHSSSSLSWSITHHLGLDKATARTLALFGLTPKTSAFLHTGADVANLALAERESDGLRVGVLATAGVQGNAMRASVDSGNYVEPGTINLIILTNRKLTPAAMTQLLILATEAKTAALEDLDIRSSYTGTAATGTGTDNVVVVAGAGARATMGGGHTKLGELAGKAVYAAVREAIARQNHLSSGRDIFLRLAERKIVPAALFNQSARLRDETARLRLAAELEKTLFLPRYAGFLEGALALSDAYERGLVRDTGAFSLQCLAVAGELAGKDVDGLEPIVTDAGLPFIMQEALNALATGIMWR